jgi:hypothetical protein
LDVNTNPPDPDDAYWAAQPPAVRALRNMDDLDARRALAAELTSKGYTIDVPIMVWGWSATKTMALRQQWGYTWVPSAGMAPVAVAPGLNVPGLPGYNPAPPPGAILV